MLVRLGLDVSGMKLGAVEGQLEKLGSRLQSLGAGLTVGVTAPIMAIGGAAVKMAMDAVESENLFKESFKGMADQARDWSTVTAAALGLNQYELRKTSSTFFVMFDAMGLGKDASFEMATGLAKLAYDFASFYNLKPEEAFTKLRAGIMGETEPLKTLGILVDQNTAKHYAYAQGIAKNGAELTQQQAVLARYAAILGQTSAAQGDLGRTLDSPSNQLRVMKERVVEATISFGMALMPVIQSATSFISALVPRLQDAAKWFDALSPGVKTVTVVIGGLLAAMGPLLVAVGSVVGGWAAVAPVFAGAASVIWSVVGLFGAVVAAINPVTLAIGFLVTAVMTIPGAWDAVRGAASSVWGVLGDLGSWLSGFAQNVGGFVVGAVFMLGRGLLDLARAIGTVLMPVVDVAVAAFGAIGDAIEWAWSKAKQFIPGLGAAASALSSAASATVKWVKGLGDVDTAHAQTTESAAAVENSAALLASRYISGADAANFFKEAAGGLAPAIGKGKTAATEAADAFAKMRASLRGDEMLAQATLAVRGIEAIGGVTKLTGDEQVKLRDQLVAAIEKYTALGQQAPPQVFRVATELDGLVAKTKDATDHVALLGIELDKALTPPELANGQGLEGFFAPLKKAVASSGTESAKTFSERFAAGVKGALQDFGPTVMQTLTGGGSVKDAIGGLIGGNIASGIGESLARTAPKFMETALGGALGSVLPGLGNLIGPLLTKGLSAAWDGLKGLFGGVSKEVKEARTDVAGFQETLAGLSTTTQRAEAAMSGWGDRGALSLIVVRDALASIGRSGAEADAMVKQLWDTDHPNRARAAMDAIGAVLDQQKAKLGELQVVVSPVFAELVAAGQRVGAEIPPEVQAVVDRMVALGAITKEQAAGFAALGQDAVPTLDQITSAAKELGIPLEALGPKLNSQRLAVDFDTIYGRIQTVARGTGDMGLALSGAKEEVSKLVFEAMRIGAEIPASMRPFVQNLIDTGNLIDEDGAKLTDISKLNFAEPIAERLTVVADKLTQILDRITSVGGGLSTTVPYAASIATGAIDRFADDAIARFQEVGRSISEDIIEMHSPTGIEGIIHYFGLAADAAGSFADQVRGRLREVRDEIGGIAGGLDGVLGKMEFVNSGRAFDLADTGVSEAAQATHQGFISLTEAIDRARAVAKDFGVELTDPLLSKLGERYGHKGEAWLDENDVMRFLAEASKQTLTPFGTGGIVTGPTAGLVGEAGPEAIVPLDRLGEFTTPDNGEVLDALERVERAVGDIPFMLARALKGYALTT